MWGWGLGGWGGGVGKNVTSLVFRLHVQCGIRELFVFDCLEHCTRLCLYAQTLFISRLPYNNSPMVVFNGSFQAGTVHIHCTYCVQKQLSHILHV